MKFYLIHCGFSDDDVFDGIYESHVNFFVAARDFDEARAKARLNPLFKEKKMHLDGLQEVAAVDGYRVVLEKDPSLAGKSSISSFHKRDLKKLPEPS
jgi:hypothetical protein